MDRGSSKVVKRRNKPSLICTNCKSKKVKCDRNLPCSSCMKSGKEASCIYSGKRPITAKGNINVQDQNSNYAFDEINHIKEKISELEKSLIQIEMGSKEGLSVPRVSNEIPHLANILQIPTTDNNDFFNIYEGYSSMYVKEPYRRVNFGPLTWSYFMNKDPWLRYLWKYTNENDDANICIYSKKIPKINKENSSVFESSENDELKGGKISEKIFRRRLLEQDGYEEYAPFKPLNNLQPEEFIKQTKSLNTSSLVFAKALIEGKYDAELHLFEKIKIVTPKKKALWSLIDIFFIKLYPFMPFVDQKEFISSLTKIFGPISYVDERVEEIKIKQKLDLAIVAQFLIIIRLTYLSLFSNRECINEHVMNNPTSPESPFDYNYLLSTPINLTTIDIAKNCIDTFQFTRKSNLYVLQALIFMRIYHKISPEYGDGVDGGDSIISSSIIVQVAVSIGLNREPNNFEDVCNDERINNLGRKIWASIVQESYLNSMMSGFHCMVNVWNSDVLEPYFNGKNSNVSDTILEEIILKEFTWLPKRIPLDDFLISITSIKESINTNKFIHNLNTIEGLCIRELFTIGNINPVMDDLKFLEVKRAQLFLLIRSSLMSAYSHLFYHFEEIKNVDYTFFFIKKQYIILYEELIPFYFEIVLGKYNSFGLALNPSIELCLHKSSQSNLYILARLMYLKLFMERTPDHSRNMINNFSYSRQFNSIINLINNVKKIGEILIIAISKFASKYFYAWRVSRAHNLLIKFLMKNDIYQDSLNKKMPIKSITFSYSQINELEEITNQIIYRFSNIIFYNDVYESEVPEYLRDSQNNGSLNMDNYQSSSTSSSSELFQNNENIDKLWLSILSNEIYPNVFGIDSEFDLSKEDIDYNSLSNLQFDLDMNDA